MRISDWSSDVCSSDLDADAPKEMVIVDGKQRLTAILGFMKGNVAVFGGHHFSDFDDQSQRDILAPTGRLRVQMAMHALQHRHELLQLYIELIEGAIAKPSTVEQTPETQQLKRH